VTATAFLLLALAAVAAVIDWYAVAAGRRVVEYVAKPATLALLIGVARALDAHSGAVQAAFVVALALSLVGDVLLLLPGEAAFALGLGAFLLAHVAYVVGFWISGVSIEAFLLGLVVVAIAIVVLGRRIVEAVAAGEESAMVGPVALYMGVISLMVASAIGTTRVLPIAGACLFYSSDALIAWTRFVHDLPRGRLAVMVTYHLAQLLLVLSLI
jgi:uncharacterized membrane protein YhhN